MKKFAKTFTAAAMIAAMALIAGCGGVCSRAMSVEVDDQGVIRDLQVVGGCNGNLQGISALVKAMQDLKAKTAEKSGGTLDIQIYPAGQLFNDKNMNDALISGGVDMGLNTVGRWASIVPAMDVFDLPFLFPTYEKIGKAVDGGLGDKLGAELEKKGVRPRLCTVRQQQKADSIA